MRVFLILLFVTALGGECCAAFSGAGVWPAWENWRKRKAWINEAYSSVVEVCTIAGVAPPPAPTWWRSNVTTLKNCKLALTNALASAAWCDYTQISGGVFTNESSIPLLDTTPTGACVTAGLPENYLTYTPRRFLHGLGRFTNNMTGIGHPYGYTNASTVAGGSNFPAGRTFWATTDYMVPGLTNLTDIMRWTLETSITFATNYDWHGQNYSEPDKPANESWETMKTEADNTFSQRVYSMPYSEIDIGTMGRCFSGLPGVYPDYYAAWKDAQGAALVVSGVSTAMQHAVDWYVIAEPNTNFYNNGLGVSTGVLTMWSTSDESFAASVTSAVFGLGPGVAPAWCDAPVPATNYGVYTYSWTGMVIKTTSQRAVVKWDGPSGRQWIN